MRQGIRARLERLEQTAPGHADNVPVVHYPHDCEDVGAWLVEHGPGGPVAVLPSTPTVEVWDAWARRQQSSCPDPPYKWA